MRKLLFTLSLALLVSWTGAASAKTPDGLPPSVETVCDNETGAAFGLCNAYCEAMDCDSGAPQASQKACDKVRDNFVKQTGEAPPCDCPCVTQYPGFIETLNSITSQDTCFHGPSFLFGPNAALLTTTTGFNPIAVISPDGTLGVCGNFPSQPPLFITAAQGLACINLIVQKANAAGLQCPPNN